MKSAFGLSFLLASTILLAQSNPVPFVNQPLVPSAVAPGGPTFTLTVNGTGFVAGSTVNWNGTTLATTFVNSSQLTATVPAASIANASTASITVSSPAPGSGTSSALFLSISNPTNLQFSSLSVQDLGGGVNGLIVANFNNDGNVDIAARYCPGSSCGGNVLIGNGLGTFQTRGGFGGGSFFRYAPADFNGDGKLDLVETQYFDAFLGNCTSYIYLGNGDGTFTSHQIYYGLPCGDPLVGDFNADGNLDLAQWGNSDLGPIGIFVSLGNGDGSFQDPVLSNANSSYSLAAVGDFNRDGKLDLIGFSSTQIAFIQGNGDGTFQAPSTPYVLGVNTSSVVAADINGDGFLDLITLQTSPTSTYTVLLGNDDGTFNAQAAVPIGGPIGAGTTITIPDMNADGRLDLVFPADQPNNQTVFIIPGNGDGTFQSAVQVASNTNVTATGDFNNDGQMDLAVYGAILLQGPNFTIALASGSSSSKTISAGQDATFNLSVTPSAGFAGTLNLTCAITPVLSPAPTCSLQPASFQISGTSAQSVGVIVGTTAGTAGGADPSTDFPTVMGPIVWTATLLALLWLWIGNRKSLIGLASLATMLALALCVACSGGSSPHATQGTPAGTYTATVTAASGGLNHSTELTVIVQ